MRIKKIASTRRKFIVTNNISSTREIGNVSSRLGELMYAIIEQTNESGIGNMSQKDKIVEL